MAARTRVRGLSPEDVQAIRDGVAAGRRPKVLFTEAAGQIAGQLGQVVSVGDPAESDEFVVVRFGRDELPFSPGDLQVAPKGATGRKAAAPPVAAPVRVEPEFVIDKPVVPSARRREAASSSPGPGSAGSSRRASARGPGVASGAGASGAPSSSSLAPAAAATSSTSPPLPAAAASRPSPAVSSAAVSTAAASSPRGSSPSADAAGVTPGLAGSSSSPPPASRRKAARPAKPKGPAGLTVTLAYAEGEWTVAASQGAKTLARPYVVKPAEALRMVSLVDVPGVQEAVAQILAAERDEAEREAERLRAELAEVEARLAELREAG